MTENELRQSVVSRFSEWLGYSEETGSHKAIIDIYNQQGKLPVGYKVSYSDPWCATAVTAVFLSLGISNIIYPECGCTRMMNSFKKNNLWKTDSPEKGDIIFYSWNMNEEADHVGIVSSVNGNTISVIEGNYHDQVGVRTITTDFKYIIGYAIPNYKKIAENVIEEKIILRVPSDHKEFTAEEFLATIHRAVVQDMRETGILASLTAAQALLESGRGNSTLTRMYNNVFGMKVGTGWTGDIVELPTTEYYNGVKTTVIAKWKVYANWSESIADHSALFNKYDRYKNLRGLTDYKLACQYVREDGYATSPTYTTSLISIIEQYKLYEWDKEALSNTKENGYSVFGYDLYDIGFGNKGAELKFLQSMLTAEGYHCDEEEFGEQTARALVFYMIDKKTLTINEKTWQNLIRACS